MELKQTVCSVLIRSVADSKSLLFVAMKMKYYPPPPIISLLTSTILHALYTL